MSLTTPVLPDSRRSLAAAKAKLDEGDVILAFACLRRWEWPWVLSEPTYLLFFDCCVQAARTMDQFQDIVKAACQDCMRIQELPSPFTCFNPSSDEWRDRYGTVPPPWCARPGTLPAWAMSGWEVYKIHHPHLALAKFEPGYVASSHYPTCPLIRHRRWQVDSTALADSQQEPADTDLDDSQDSSDTALAAPDSQADPSAGRPAPKPIRLVRSRQVNRCDMCLQWIENPLNGKRHENCRAIGRLMGEGQAKMHIQRAMKDMNIEEKERLARSYRELEAHILDTALADTRPRKTELEAKIVAVMDVVFSERIPKRRRLTTPELQEHVCNLMTPEYLQHLCHPVDLGPVEPSLLQPSPRKSIPDAPSSPTATTSKRQPSPRKSIHVAAAMVQDAD